MTEADSDLWRRHHTVVEVKRAAAPKLDVVKHLAERFPELAVELERLEDLRAEHFHGNIPKDIYLMGLEELTGTDYGDIYDAAYRSHDVQNIKECLSSLIQSIGDRFQRDR